MNIHLPPELEKIVNEELKSGHFRTVEEVIGRALEVLRERARMAGSESNGQAQREAVREMLAFAERNRTVLQGVSVKGLIHEGHRL